MRRGLAALGGLALVITTVLVGASTASVGARVRNVRRVDQVVTIHIRDNSFSPAALNVAAGTTIRWVNDGRNTHNVTPDAGDAYRSGNLKPGKSYVHTFEDAGSFAYYCTLHGTPTGGQHAQLAVGDAAAATPVTPVGQRSPSAPTAS